MPASPANPQVIAPYTLIYAGNRTGAVNSTLYNDVSIAIAAAQAAIAGGEKILVLGYIELAHRTLRMPASLVTP